jgi:hypothetical protein
VTPIILLNAINYKMNYRSLHELKIKQKFVQTSFFFLLIKFNTIPHPIKTLLESLQGALTILKGFNYVTIINTHDNEIIQKYMKIRCKRISFLP